MEDCITYSWNNGEVQTSFYGSEWEKNGFAMAVTGWGRIDLFIPRKVKAFDCNTGREVLEAGNKVVREIRTGKFAECVCSDSRTTFYFYDGSDYPYMFAVKNEQFLNRPAKSDDGRTAPVRIFAYNETDNKVFTVAEMPCRVTVVKTELTA